MGVVRVLAFLPSGLKISPADLRQTSSGLALLPRFPSTGTVPLVCSFKDLAGKKTVFYLTWWLIH